MIGSAERTISLPIRANTQSATLVFRRSGSPTANECWRSDVAQVTAWSAWQHAVGHTGQVHGVDISWGMMAVARARVRSAGLRNVTLTIGDARVLCFRSSVFDAVFMSFTLELFEEAIPNVLAEVRRVLRVGGRVGIVAMSDSGQTNAMIDLYEWLHRRWPHFIDCRPIDVVGVLQEAHFHASYSSGHGDLGASSRSPRSESKHRPAHRKVRPHDESSIQG